MSRPPNPVDTVQLRIATTPGVEQHLESLVRTGLYGKTKAEAAERLLAEGVQRLLREGLLLKGSELVSSTQHNQREEHGPHGRR